MNILLEKLQKYGIRHKAHKMLSSYLSSRTQKVNIRNTYSAYKDITMGVPQVSILGPILFIIYINDLPNLSANMTCLSYADDTAIIFKNKNCNHLQRSVNALLHRISDWFHANFTTHLTEFKLDVKIDNVPVEEKDSLKYLGMFIDKSLKLSKNTLITSNIISRNIGIIARIR